MSTELTRGTGYYPGKQGTEPRSTTTTTNIGSPLKRQTGTSSNPNSPNYNPSSSTTTKLGGQRKKRRGGKWSLKYKRSINCRRPKGFSQRQHCKYGRKTRKN
jgi:hypothetical protein